MVDIFNNKLACTPGNNGDLFIGSALPSNSPYRDNPTLKLNLRGGDLALDCEGCAGLAAHFDRCGAFKDTVWGVVAHDATLQLRIRGYSSITDWPFGGEVVRDLTPGAVTGRRFYAESGIDRRKYPVLAFEEIGEDRRHFVSDPVQWTSKPKDWRELETFNDAPVEIAKAGKPFVQEVWRGENNQIVTTRSESRTLDANPYPGAEAGLYAVVGETDAFLVIEQANLLQLSSPCSSCPASWEYEEVRLFTGDGSVASQQDAAGMLKQGNDDYKAWCDAHPGQCTKLYPEKPPLGILIDPAVASSVTFASFADEMCMDTCPDFNQGANLGSTPLEDLPIYWVPARSIDEMQRFAGSANRYHRPIWPVPPGEHRYRGLVVLGNKRVTGERLRDPDAIASNWENVLHGIGEPVYTILSSSDFPSDPHIKRDAFVAEINSGISTLFAYEANRVTRVEKWPGNFFWNTTINPPPNEWDQLMTRPQSMVAVLIGCNMGNMAENHGMFRFILRDALFAASTKTAIVFAVASGPSMDLHNYLWANVLAAELQDAPDGTPWPVIVFNAKTRALAQYPYMLNTLRSIVSLGTMVRKHALSTTDVDPSANADNRTLGGAPQLRTVGGPGGRPRVEVSLPQGDDVTLSVYDGRGRVVATLWQARMEGGRRTVTWDGFGRDGNPARSGVYFVRLFSRNSGTASTKVIVLR